MFWDKVLRIFGQNIEEVTGEWRRLHNEEHHDLCPLTGTSRLIKARSMRSAKYVTHRGK
jgi:hypothetical protein